MSVHTRPAQVECQDLAIRKFNSSNRIIAIPPLCQFGMSCILTHGEYPSHLFLRVGRIGSVQEPTTNVDIVYTAIYVYPTRSLRVLDKET